MFGDDARSDRSEVMGFGSNTVAMSDWGEVRTRVRSHSASMATRPRVLSGEVRPRSASFLLACAGGPGGIELGNVRQFAVVDTHQSLFPGADNGGNPFAWRDIDAAERDELRRIVTETDPSPQEAKHDHCIANWVIGVLWMGGLGLLIAYTAM